MFKVHDVTTGAVFGEDLTYEEACRLFFRTAYKYRLADIQDAGLRVRNQETGLTHSIVLPRSKKHD